MHYRIYFDESNKLDQAEAHYSYYGALGMNSSIKDELTNDVEQLYRALNTLYYKSDAERCRLKKLGRWPSTF